MLMAAITYSPIVRIRVVGPLVVTPHGIFTAVGFLVGAWFFMRDVRRVGLPEEAVTSILYRAAIGGIVGARVAYVLNHLDTYASPLEWLEVWEGGISLLGGLAGALVVAWWSAGRRSIDFVAALDLASPWLPLGIAVGRIGDIVIADHLGRPTALPWGYRCPDLVDVGRTVGSPCPPGEVVHLTAAYDLVLSFAIFAVMTLLARRWSATWPRGAMSLALGVLYGVNRFTLDFARADDRRLGLTGSQWTALAVAVTGSALLARLVVHRSGSSPPGPPDISDMSDHSRAPGRSTP